MYVDKRTPEDYKKIIETQSKALRILSKRCLAKEKEITKLNLEMRHYRDVIRTKKYESELQKRIDKAIKYIDSLCLEKDGYVGYGDDLSPIDLIEILKDNE